MLLASGTRCYQVSAEERHLVPDAEVVSRVGKETKESCSAASGAGNKKIRVVCPSAFGQVIVIVITLHSGGKGRM